MTRHTPYLLASGDFWQKQRCRALVRDDFTCQFQQLGLLELAGECTVDQPQTQYDQLQVHHIIPRTHFLQDQFEGHDLSNLLTLCVEHHAFIHPFMKRHLKRPLKMVGKVYPSREL
jgi:5-methylcytosine-specific restriction endonuclease McrA